MRHIGQELALGLIGLLGVNFFGCDDASTGTQHQACWGLCRSRCLTTGLPHVLIQQIFEHGAVALEARGVDVGQVVLDNRQARLLRVQTGFRYPH